MTERYQARDEVVYAAIITLDEDVLLLPNSALLDVLPMTLLEPDLPGDRASAGLAGWYLRGEQRLPVIQFEVLLGRNVAPPNMRGRLVVIQGVAAPEARLVLVADAAPRRVTLNRQVLTADSDGGDMEFGVAQRCRIARQRVIIPDLAALAERAQTFIAST